MRALVIGFGLGFVVAFQLGPMSLFLIRSTLRVGVRTGLAIGAGIACIDMAYAAAGAAGAAPLLAVEGLRVAAGVVGAMVLAALGVRTLWSSVRVRAGAEVPVEVATPRRAFVTALGATASNPATIVSWAAIFAAASAATDAQPLGLLAGVGLGSLTWVTVLAVATAVVRRAAGPRAMRFADGVAGVGLVGFAGALGYRTVHRS
jgi:putative LysE/RhtB family amino acid efflux pump